MKRALFSLTPGSGPSSLPWNEKGMTLRAARDSIHDRCQSTEVKIPLSAFCGECQWKEMQFNCDARVEYLVDIYNNRPDKAREGLLEKGECVDPSYVPPSRNKAENDAGGSRSQLSNGAIVGIVLGITAFLLIILAYWATRRRQAEKEGGGSEKLENKTTVPLGSADLPVPKERGEESAVVKPVPEPLARSNSDRSKNKKKKKTRTISFATDKPDPDGSCQFIESDNYDAMIAAKGDDEIPQSELIPPAVSDPSTEGAAVEEDETEGMAPVEDETQGMATVTEEMAVEKAQAKNDWMDVSIHLTDDEGDDKQGGKGGDTREKESADGPPKEEVKEGMDP